MGHWWALGHILRGACFNPTVSAARDSVGLSLLQRALIKAKHNLLR
jgi:hypothetical protein